MEERNMELYLFEAERGKALFALIIGYLLGASTAVFCMLAYVWLFV